MYQHQWQDGSSVDWVPGKVVCVGRNYADHARELNNPVPTEPILFIKPATAMVAAAEPFSIPADRGVVHFETEMALLIGKTLSDADEDESLAAIAGVGLGFDITLRELQDKLKAKSHPWEVAKAFDGSCPLSAFAPVSEPLDWANIAIQMSCNGQLRQDGNSEAMITPVARLLAYTSRIFTLQPGDVVMTGTPAGVGPLQAGDKLQATLSCQGQTLVELASSVKG
ncbi:fumarylacetoacetate hydrolase family protein [Maricurvus nonylphenolicus]|uniref:fumarylacetoacetate hydrolase family protein n=1 Tax=Maricurvus nonylphenolicus TaxID=1008307 RepID=UPI0036F2E78A